jgi:dTDP-4-amino-4,6-dideoxygalactose transaminase
MTFAPIPKLHNIAIALIKPPLSEKLLSDSWISKNDTSYWLSQSSWSLYLIIKFRCLINPKSQVNVWFPDYFCNESTVQIRSLGINLSFYPVLSDGKPDLLFCNRMLDNAQPDVILYVNYFGEPLFSKGLGEIAKESKAWLIEDSAHCLKPERGIGGFGDFVIYSPHKLLSIPDGALLVIRNNGPSKITQTFLEEFGFDSVYRSLIEMSKSLNLMSFKWTSKRLIQKLGLHRLYNPKAINNKTLNIEQLPHPRMSKFSQKLLSVLLDLEKESIHRKEIQKKWDESLSDLTTIKGFELAQKNFFYIPYLAKIASRDGMSAKDIIDLFKNSKIPISTWPDLPPEVLQNPDTHKNAIEMRRKYVFFPVHSSINAKNLKLVTGGL